MYQWSYCKGGIPTNIDGINLIKWNAWPRTVTGDWATLVTSLYRVNEIPHFYPDGSPIEAQHDAKMCAPSISGAVYPEGQKRGKEFIQSINLLIIDVDNKGEPETQLNWETAMQLVSYLPYRLVLYTTYSNSEERNKFRILLPLAKGVKPDLWPEYLEWAIAQLGLSQYREAMDLGCMRKPAQVYFMQGAWDPEGIQIQWKDGVDLPVPEETDLMVIPVPDLPGVPFKPGLSDTDFSRVRSYNVDLNTLDLIGVLRQLGITMSTEQTIAGGVKVRCHCPWAKTHTGGRDDDGSYVIQVDDKWPVFRCSHSNHQGFGLLDVLDLAGPRIVAMHGDPYVKPARPFVGIKSLKLGDSNE